MGFVVTGQRWKEKVREWQTSRRFVTVVTSEEGLSDE
jgi:hypothetical protein